MEKYNIHDYGALGDGKTINTSIIQNVIDSCSGGDIVIIPKGIYVTGALYLHSDIEIVLNEGAVLKGSDNISDYPPFVYRFEGIEQLCYSSLINMIDGEHNNVVISGTGIIDGSGIELYSKEIQTTNIKRGRVICIRNTNNCVIKDVTICNSVCWTLHMIYCKKVVINNIQIHSKNSYDKLQYNDKLRNGDGIVIDSCENVIIDNCVIRSQDDCVSIKSGKNEEGRIINRSSNTISVSGCTFLDGAGVSIGSEMSGGVYDVIIQNCQFSNVLSILTIKTNAYRGGYIRNIKIENCKLINIYTNLKYKPDYKAAIYIDEFYKSEQEYKSNSVQLTYPIVENITLQNLLIINCIGEALYINGLAESPIKSLLLDNIIAYSKGEFEIYNTPFTAKRFHVNGVVVTPVY